MSPEKIAGVLAERTIAALGVESFRSQFLIRSVPKAYRFDAAPLFDFGFNGVYLFFVILEFNVPRF